MGFHIQYGKTFCRNLTITISPASPFARILATLNSVHYDGCRLTTEQINYAVLELLNNSLRAHRDRGVRDPIVLRFSMQPNGLSVYLRDRGGGFDTTQLPYWLHDDPTTIDVHNEAFEAYRRKHNYTRFGMGIYLAKKTFPFFSLTFVDGNGETTAWSNGDTDGTIIELSTTAANTSGGDKAATNPLASEEQNIYA